MWTRSRKHKYTTTISSAIQHFKFNKYRGWRGLRGNMVGMWTPGGGCPSVRWIFILPLPSQRPPVQLAARLGVQKAAVSHMDQSGDNSSRECAHRVDACVWSADRWTHGRMCIWIGCVGLKRVCMFVCLLGISTSGHRMSSSCLCSRTLNLWVWAY